MTSIQLADFFSPEQLKLTTGRRSSKSKRCAQENQNKKAEAPREEDLWSINSVTAPKEWEVEQQRLAKLCVTEDRLKGWSVDKIGKISGLERIAGVDVSFFPDGEHAVVAVAVLSYPALDVIYERCVTMRLSMPYVPDFLAFREAPACAALLASLPEDMRPQAVFVDGNGVFHPRRCGCATHLGVSIGLPTIGVAKTVLQVGNVGAKDVWHIASRLTKSGSWASLKVDGKPLAAVLWPCEQATSPLVVSAGHFISLRSAATLTASLCRQEVAEPVRQADLIGRAAVRRWMAGEPMTDVHILAARTERKGAEESVLPVIRTLLARRAAEELGEGWAPVESRRERRCRKADKLLTLLNPSKVAIKSRASTRGSKCKKTTNKPEHSAITEQTEGQGEKQLIALSNSTEFPALLSKNAKGHMARLSLAASRRSKEIPTSGEAVAATDFDAETSAGSVSEVGSSLSETSDLDQEAQQQRLDDGAAVADGWDD